MGEPKKIGERVLIRNEEDGGYVVELLPYYEGSKQWLLGAWTFALTLCGLYIFFRTFSDDPAEQKLVYIVFLAFFGYFEYMALYAFFWRLQGKEELRVGNGELRIRSGAFKIKEERIPFEAIKRIGPVHYDEGAFKTQFESAYYVVGMEGLEVELSDKKLRFGEKLDEKDTKALLKRLDKSIGSNGRH